MQPFEVALTEELKTIPELQSRVYPLRAPEATKHNGVPYLIYGSSDGVRDKSLNGFMKSKEVRAELNILAARYADMKAITKKVVALLISFEKRQIGTDGPLIDELIYMQPIETYENQPELHRCMIEFTVYFDEED